MSLSSFYFGPHAKSYTEASSFAKMWQDTGCSVGPAVFYIEILHFSRFSQPIGGAFNPRNKTLSQIAVFSQLLYKGLYLLLLKPILDGK